MRYVIEPHLGIGPARLGMDRDQVARLALPRDEAVRIVTEHVGAAGSFALRR